MNRETWKALQDMYINEAMNNKLQEENKWIKIKSKKQSIYCICELQYDTSIKFKSDLTFLFDCHLIRECKIIIREIYQIENGEKIIYTHPVLKNKIIGSVFAPDYNNERTYLIANHMNLESISYGVMIKNELVPIDKITNSLDLLPRILEKNTVIQGTLWNIEEITSMMKEIKYLIELRR